MAATNGSVGEATVGVPTSAASSHLIALFASLNATGASGARLTSTSRKTAGRSSQGTNPSRRVRGVNGDNAEVQMAASHSADLGFAPGR
jgi:hypothetical protein